MDAQSDYAAGWRHGLSDGLHVRQRDWAERQTRWLWVAGGAYLLGWACGLSSVVIAVRWFGVVVR